MVGWQGQTRVPRCIYVPVCVVSEESLGLSGLMSVVFLSPLIAAGLL